MRVERQITSVTNEKVEEVKGKVIANHQEISIREVAKEVGVSNG